MPGEKYYKAERERQKKFLESEKKLEENYKKVRKEESDYEYLNSLFREDSTREYNPVEHYKRGGIAKGCGKVMNDRRKVTKMY